MSNDKGPPDDIIPTTRGPVTQELKLYPHQKVAIDALRELPDEASVYKRDFTKTEMRIVDSILSEEARQRLYKSLLVSKHKSAIIGHPQTLRLLKEADGSLRLQRGYLRMLPCRFGVGASRLARH